MQNSVFSVSALIALAGIAAIPAHAALQVGATLAIIPQGGGDIVRFLDATFINTDPTTPIYLTDAFDLTFHGNFGPASVTNFTFATEIANAGPSGLEIAPGATLDFTGEKAIPA